MSVTTTPDAAANPPQAVIGGADDEAEPGFSAWFAVGLLTAIYLVSFMDRQILSVLVEPIRADLGISDTTMGLIQGVSFGLLFTLATIPLGWLADRMSRKKLIAGAVVVWSTLTAACGLATNAIQLLFTRVGVGLGEAALGPCAAPMIRELFPTRRIVSALSIYMLGIPLGGGVALLLGSTLYPWMESLGSVHAPLIGELKPWQSTFMLVALPGFVLAGLILLIREPERRFRKEEGEGSITDAMAYMKRNWKSFLGLGLPGIAAMSLTFGVGFWIPAALARVHDLDQSAVSGYLKTWGMMTIVLGCIGSLMGGLAADWIRKRREDGHILYALIGILMMSGSYGLFCLAPTPQTSLFALAPAALAVAIPPVAATAAAMEIIPRQMRSLVFATWMAGVSLLGTSIGPPVVGWLSDVLPGGLGAAIPVYCLAAAAFAAPILLGARKPCIATAAEAREVSARGLVA